ncbi:long-chain fatty acid--CoA ligase [Streptomyces piniterrae]|uniref:Long-chain fatty acid--CoA ligase n=1 Tax=Streptomyces piniterrae TaxID=2571125 RepID=A0A4U0NVM0_9ACTN|nr:long-chain fatty acid--CoA ligase [Streptomyces piniterrae]TJZ58739.1 long-chain fatty acid--CoA ligase [Streptomyces piniterrae]
MPNLATRLVKSARRFPDRPAVRLGTQTVTYAALDALSAHVAADLRARGVTPGDRVAVMLPNVPEFVALYFGVLRAGGIVVPLDPLLTERETEYHLRDSGASVLYAWRDGPGGSAQGAAAADTDLLPVGAGEFAARRPAPDREVAAVRDADLAVLLYTSGTTGRPKGAALTHGGIAHNTKVNATTLQHLGPADVVLGCLPLFHSFGQVCAMNSVIHRGASLTLVPRFEPGAVLGAIARDRVTVFDGVPAMFSALLHHPAVHEADVSSLRLCVSGGSSLPVEVLYEFELVFGCAVLEGFGMSETASIVSFNHPDRPRKPGSIGTPVREVRMRLLDEHGADVRPGRIGELAVRGPNVMQEYWRRPAETRAAIPDGWLRTGDLARQDADGYYFIVDRKQDMIIRGGCQVSPREIEEVLYGHPAVAQAAVVGVPDDRFGEEVAAAVVTRPGARTDAEELREYVRERVEASTYPRHVWLVDALPTGPTGKILKCRIERPQ